MHRPMWFEIPVNNPGKAMEFYGGVLGWKFTPFPGGPMEYWTIETGPKDQPGINGGLLLRRDPAQPCVNTVDVASVDETLSKVVAAGGKIAVPKMHIPGAGDLAYCQDPEGNMFGILEPNPNAK